MARVEDISQRVQQAEQRAREGGLEGFIDLRASLIDAAAPRGRVYSWWDRVSGQKAVREQRINQTWLYLLEETERVREQGKMKGAQLVANTAAHLLNSALSITTGYAELLLLRPAISTDPQLRGVVQNMFDASQNAANIVSDLGRIKGLVLDPKTVEIGNPSLDLERSIRLNTQP